jgi:hypothetical protein
MRALTAKILTGSKHKKHQSIRAWRTELSVRQTRGDTGTARIYSLQKGTRVSGEGDNGGWDSGSSQQLKQWDFGKSSSTGLI